MWLILRWVKFQRDFLKVFFDDWGGLDREWTGLKVVQNDGDYDRGFVGVSMGNLSWKEQYIRYSTAMEDEACHVTF